MPRPIVLRSIAVLFACATAIPSMGCSCESQCQTKYNECIDRAPAGAARQDCEEAYQGCLNSCQQRDEPVANADAKR